MEEVAIPLGVAICRIIALYSDLGMRMLAARCIVGGNVGGMGGRAGGQGIGSDTSKHSTTQF